MCKHIAVVLPNLPGQFLEIADLLASHNINILGYALCSEGRPGLLYLLCSPHQQAAYHLKERYKYYCTEKEVEIIPVAHKPGQLVPVLRALSQGSPPVNLPNSYQAFTTSGDALMVLEFDSLSEQQRGQTLLSNAGIGVLDRPPS